MRSNRASPTIHSLIDAAVGQACSAERYGGVDRDDVRSVVLHRLVVRAKNLGIEAVSVDGLLAGIGADEAYIRTVVNSVIARQAHRPERAGERRFIAERPPCSVVDAVECPAPEDPHGGVEVRDLLEALRRHMPGNAKAELALGSLFGEQSVDAYAMQHGITLRTANEHLSQGWKDLGRMARKLSGEE